MIKMRSYTLRRTKNDWPILVLTGSEVTLGSNLHVSDLDLNDTIQLKVKPGIIYFIKCNRRVLSFNCKISSNGTNQGYIALHALSLLFWHFINTTAYHLDLHLLPLQISLNVIIKLLLRSSGFENCSSNPIIGIFIRILVNSKQSNAVKRTNGQWLPFKKQSIVVLFELEQGILTSNNHCDLEDLLEWRTTTTTKLHQNTKIFIISYSYGINQYRHSSSFWEKAAAYSVWIATRVGSSWTDLWTRRPTMRSFTSGFVPPIAPVTSPSPSLSSTAWRSKRRHPSSAVWPSSTATTLHSDKMVTILIYWQWLWSSW